MKIILMAVIFAGLSSIATAEEITEVDKKVIEAYLQPNNHLTFIELYTQMTGKQFAEVKDHIKYLQDISAVKYVWDQEVKENNAINKRIIDVFLKPRNKLFLVDLYVKMTGSSYDEAVVKCKLIAEHNEEVKAKWNKQYEVRKQQVGLKESKRKECDRYLVQARTLHSSINYTQHNKCVAYNDAAKYDEYSERKDFEKTIKQCLKTESDFNNKFSDYESLLEKQQNCINELQVM